MPLVKIEIREGKSKEYKKALLDGVHQALVQAIKIPDHDRIQRLYELDSGNFEAKKQLYKAIIDNLAKNPGIKNDDITIVLHEPPLENWGIRGGKPANEVDIGFKIVV